MDDADLAAIGAAFDWDYGVDDVEDSDRWVCGGGGGGGVWGCGGGGGGGGRWLRSLPAAAQEDPERLGGGLADIGGSVVGGEDEDKEGKLAEPALGSSVR